MSELIAASPVHSSSKFLLSIFTSREMHIGTYVSYFYLRCVANDTPASSPCPTPQLDGRPPGDNRVRRGRSQGHPTDAAENENVTRQGERFGSHCQPHMGAAATDERRGFRL